MSAALESVMRVRFSARRAASRGEMMMTGPGGGNFSGGGWLVRVLAQRFDVVVSCWGTTLSRITQALHPGYALLTAPDQLDELMRVTRYPKMRAR